VETILHGPVRDQAGCTALLHELQSLGLGGIEVRRLPEGSRASEREPRSRPRHGIALDPRHRAR
jgi:hypothetical protein